MANIQLKNLYICENVIVSFNGQLSLINIINEISSNAFPAVHPKINVMVRVTGDIGTYDEKVEIVSVEDNKTIAVVGGKAEIKAEGGNSFIANFINTLFAREGKYWVRVTVDNKILTNQSDHFIFLKKV